MGKIISLLDTNIITRFLTSDKNVKYKGLYRFFESLEQGEIQVELKLIVLFQVIFVLKSFYNVQKIDIAEGMLDLLEYRGISIKEKRIVHRALELWRDKNLEIVDCYLVASLASNPRNLLFSYDRNFDKFKIRRKEP